MSKENTTIIGGNGFFGLLFITFLVLKLTNVINWSWWWITAPLWAPIGLAVVLFVIVATVYLIATINDIK